MSLPSLRAAHNKSSRSFGKWAAILVFLLFSVIVTLLASRADTQVFLLNIGEAEDDQSRTTPPCKIDDYFTSHQAEFKNIDLTGDAVKTMAVPESSLMDAVLESQPSSKNNPRVTLIDIGGNMGDMSAMMRAKWGPEPKIHIYDVIQAFVQKLSNRFQGDSQIQVHHNALSSKAGETVKILGSRDWLKKNAFHTGASVLSRGGQYDAVIEEVATTTLDTIVESNAPLFEKPGSIPFCKIDTEGNDYSVLLGGRKTLQRKIISTIFFENNKMQENIGASLFKTVQYLEEMGYNTYYFSKRKLFPLNNLCEESDIFQSKETGNGVALPANTPLETSILKLYAEKRA